MLITIEQLQEHRVKFDELFPPGHIDYSTDEIRQVEPLRVRGSASLLVDEIEIRGHLATVVEATCARCLDPTGHPVDTDFDLIYRPLSSITRSDEFRVPAGEEEIGFYREDALLLEDVAKEQVLLSLPIRSLCQTDCRGLCRTCGRNLNRETCPCPRPSGDGRWEALRE